MDENEFRLIRALMLNNDDMRVIAVGDDDQNIYEFRGSDSKFMLALIGEYGATRYEMTENYRSKSNIVALANEFVTCIGKRMKRTPIQSMKEDVGQVQIVHYCSDNLAEPVVNQVISTYHGGKACVLTSTNDEALCVMGLLLKKGVRAKLIQTIDGFQLYNLAEVRYFLQVIDKDLHSPVISNELWESAKRKLSAVYRDSACLENCLNMISEFEKTNTYSKYRTDFEEFIKESQYEDFYTDDRETVFVSTIHKAKGREFDSVYMLLNHYSISQDAAKRTLYVGMTRAKENLYINCNTDLFSSYHIQGIQQSDDNEEYSVPNEITLQLTHKDVVLDFFKNKKEIIHKLRSGMKLNMEGEYLSAELDNWTVRIAKLSKARVDELTKLEQKGYVVSAADVRFVVAWKNEDCTEEIAVVLPSLYLKLDEKE
jgi:Superfamily I DNA and RNA helicases